MERCNSPRPETRKASVVSVSSTRRETSVCISFISRARKWREVTNWPSVPAKGLSLTQKVMETVGSSIFTNGRGSAMAGSQMVSPMNSSSKPETATMSPTRALSQGTRLSPSNSYSPPSRAAGEVKLEP